MQGIVREFFRDNARTDVLLLKSDCFLVQVDHFSNFDITSEKLTDVFWSRLDFCLDDGGNYLIKSSFIDFSKELLAWACEFGIENAAKHRCICINSHESRIPITCLNAVPDTKARQHTTLCLEDVFM